MKVTGTTQGSLERASDLSKTSGAGALSGAKEKRRSTRAPEIESGITDNVAISTRAKDAAKAKELASSAPDVDEAKIARLKAAIQSGGYKVDAEKIADRLVDEHLNNSV